MKQFLFILFIGMDTTILANDSIRIEHLKKDVLEMTSRINALQKEYGLLYNEMQVHYKRQDSLNMEIFEQSNILQDSIRLTDTTMREELKVFQNAIIQDKAEITKNIRLNAFGVIAAMITLLFVQGVIFFLLLKRIKTKTNSSICEIQKYQSIHIQMDYKLIGLIEKQIASFSTTTSTDHSLALKIADEVTIMETTLSRIDTSIKGYKHLSIGIQHIKDNFKASGYEIVDMLGKPYNAGMKVVANFVVDEKLNPGQQIITGIIKPQINYNGQMIQAAHITVSQNI